MSTRLSTEELDVYDEVAVGASGFVGEEVLRFTAEIRESWKERDAARRALRDLTAALEHSPIWDDWKDAPEVVEARAVLSENLKG